MKKKNLYVLCQVNTSMNYGVGTYIDQLIMSLNKELYLSICIIEWGSKVKEFTIEIKNGIVYYYIPDTFYKLSGDNMKERYKLHGLYGLTFVIKPDVKPIFLINFYCTFDFVFFLKNYWKDSKAIFVLHYLLDDLNFFLLRPENEDEIVRNRYQDTLNCFDKIVCLSRNTQAAIKNCFHLSDEKLVFIPNGLVDTANPLPLDEKNKLKKQLGFSEKDVILLCVGRVDLTKGLTFLIEAFKEIRKFYPFLRLVIVGGGLIKEYLEQCKGNWVTITFTGLVGREEVRNFYQLADIGILPSLGEQCSFVGIEMMMHGLPCIVNCADGLNEMFFSEPAVAVKIVKLDLCKDLVWESKKIVVSLEQLLLNKQLQKELSANARKHYLTRYHIDFFRESYIKLLKQL